MDGSFFGYQYGRAFPDPFADYASRTIPTNIRQALRFCRGLFYFNPIVRETARRVLAVFITTIELKGADGNDLGQDERDKYTEFLEKQVFLYQRLQETGLDLLCFRGNTKVPTREGVFAIRDLVGRTVDVISQGGVFRPAEFKKFGQQELMEIEFSDGRKVRATPEHRWIVKNKSWKTVELSTAELIPGHRIPRTVAPRPEKNDDYFEGVRHGFVFGDGSVYNKHKKTPKAVANFFGEKDAAMLPFFEGYGCRPIKVDRGSDEVELHKQHGLPIHYKLTLPDNDASPSYWYGFVSGLFAADGTVSKRDGCAYLTQANRETIDAIVQQLPRIGMVAGVVTPYDYRSKFKRRDGSSYSSPATTAYSLPLLRRQMQADDFLIASHRKNFERCHRKTSYGGYIGVKSVTRTGRVEDVYCCTEPETHTFVIENGILTGNCEGNSFSAVVLPVRRFLYCTRCHDRGRYVENPIGDIIRDPAYEFRWEIPKFFARCPACKTMSRWERVDRRSDGSDAVIRRFGTSEIDIRYDEHRDYREYIWNPTSTYRRKVKRGDPQVLEAVPWEVVEAVDAEANLLFEPNYIYHMFEPTLSGLDHQGWGLPRVLVNARPAWQYQVYCRQNEALSLDYLTPMRWVTPDVRAGTAGEEADPLATVDMGNLRYMFDEAVSRHRFDPASYHFSSHPLKYMVMGGDIKQFATPELLNQSADMLLNSLGFPASLFRGELDIKTALPAIRLFQSYWGHLVRYLNQYIDWACTRLGAEKGWEPVTGSLISPTLIDDPQLIMAKLQLAQSGDFSKTDAVRSLGADYRVQLERQADEDRMRTAIQEKRQREMEEQGELPNLAAQQQQQQQPPQQGGGGGQPAPADAQGGAPAGPLTGMPILPNQKITPEQLLAQADAVAGDMLGRSESERQGELTKLKSRDPTMHMAVTAAIKQKRQQAQQQGGQQVLQQQYGGGAA